VFAAGLLLPYISTLSFTETRPGSCHLIPGAEITSLAKRQAGPSQQVRKQRVNA